MIQADNNIPSKGNENNLLSHELQLNLPPPFSQQTEKYWSSIKSAGGDIAGEILVSVAWGERAQQQQHHKREDSGQSPPPAVSTSIEESFEPLTPPPRTVGCVEAVSTCEDEDDEDIKEQQIGDNKQEAGTTISMNNNPDQSKSNRRRQRTVNRHATFTCGNVSVRLNSLDAVVIIGAAKSTSAMLHESREMRTEPQVGGGGGVGSNFSGTLGFKQQQQTMKGGSSQDSLALQILVWVIII